MSFTTVYHTTILNEHPLFAILVSGTIFWGEQEVSGVGQILSDLLKFSLHGISNGIYRTQTHLMNSIFCLFLGTGPILVSTREWIGQANTFFNFLKSPFHGISNGI